ncbi:gliding motility-associated C-terminal domain-containing protein [uncultured Maribacter sp.]|uniref:T9SS type B sorting domain-containing protein n=1 Tax=uncultured Maribacter sp. TaxID=431308 RepID=UPI00260C6326|nr:gliding motility-associated C-terminal domain-containing protein [uncultured Maribacter sp.]
MKTLNKLTVFTALSMLFCAFQLSAQAIVINAPEPADNPNLSGSTPWSAVCAGNGGFNEYFVNITWIGTANAGNEFILELSDASGSFTNAQTLQTITDQNAVKDFDISFAIPTDTRGEGYKMRVRSTDPEKIGSESEAFNMYYMDVTSNLNISELGDGVPPGTVCSTGDVTLQVDNIANPETYQYIWFRSGTELTSETGHTLNVTQSGMYNVYINYGPRCTGSGNTDSNIVDVTIGGSGTGIAVTAPTKTSLCSTDTETLTIDQTDASWSYQWFKDDVEIVGATSTSYNVNASNAGFEGDYAVEISGTGICNERSAVVSITNAELYTVTVENEINMVLLPTQNEVLSVSTTAVTPSYKWFRNTIEISGETNSTLTITEDGEYHAEVTQTGGACSVSSKNSDVTTVVSPASFEMTINYTDAYTSCETTSTILGVELINAVAADGTKTDVTSALLDGFTYEWSKDGAAVGGAISNSISLASNSENGDYDLNATIGSFDVDSNVLPVQLLTNETVSITSSGTVFCSGGETITLSTTTDLSSATYQWQLDGVSINTTDAVLTVSTAGTYTLAIDIDGCSLISNEIVVTPLDENLITLDPGTEIVMPEGTSRVVTASGGTAYRWLDANAVELSNSDSITFTEAGSYTLIASIDNCEIVRQIEVTYLDTFKVPNVITVNGDGINDQWIIPNSYSNKADVNVIIYNEQGQEIVNEFDYKNNWPQSTTAFTKQNMVFYYKIRNASEVLKQGTITVIR